MKYLITHQFFGPDRSNRYTTAGLDLDEAHRHIGANTLAGFDPIVYTHNARGEQLHTRDGDILTVVALTGSSVMAALELAQV